MSNRRPGCPVLPHLAAAVRAALVLALLAIALVPHAALAHRGHTSTIAWEACDDAHLGDVCAFETEAHERHVGTCRVLEDDLICVRNRPIEPAEAARGGFATSPLELAILSLALISMAISLAAWRRLGPAGARTHR